MAKIQAVVFDLYGTLLYLENRTNPYVKLFADLNLKDPKEIKQAKRIAMTENFGTLSELAENLKLDLKIDLLPYEKEIEAERKSAHLFPETKQVLEELRKRNIRIGLISNLASPYKLPFFQFGLAPYFEETVFSCDVGFIKPEKEIYLEMIKRLQIKPENILMTGDKISSDVDGPKSVRMSAVHLDRKNNSPDSIPTLEEIFVYL